MRKITVILIVILLFLLVNSWGMAQKPRNGASLDSLRLKLIEPISQNLQINCSGFDGRIYFIDDLVLNKSDIQNKKTCFILNKDFVYTELSADKQEIPLREYNWLTRWDFSPVIDEATFTAFDKNCRFYTFAFQDVANLTDQVNIRFKYHIKEQDSLQVYKVKNDMIQMNGAYFWYPRNLNRDEHLALTVKTTDEYTFSLNGETVNYEIKQAYTKEYKTELIDLREKPSTAIFQIKR
jgi:hypothetical protein